MIKQIKPTILLLNLVYLEFLITFNSKCFDEDKDPEVKIIQEFDSSKPLPNINNLLVEFMTFLSDRKLKEIMEKERQVKLK